MIIYEIGYGLAEGEKPDRGKEKRRSFDIRLMGKRSQMSFSETYSKLTQTIYYARGCFDVGNIKHSIYLRPFANFPDSVLFYTAKASLIYSFGF